MSAKDKDTKSKEVVPDGKLTLEIKGHEETYPVNAKEFKTGSRGFFASGKFTAKDGRRYQLVVNIVEIGSKPVK